MESLDYHVSCLMGEDDEVMIFTSVSFRTDRGPLRGLCIPHGPGLRGSCGREYMLCT